MAERRTGDRSRPAWAALLVVLALAGAGVERFIPLPREGLGAPIHRSSTPLPREATVRIRIDTRAARLPERDRFVAERTREARVLREMTTRGGIPARGLTFVFVDNGGRQIDRFDGVRASRISVR